MAFQRLRRHALDLVDGLAQNLLGSGGDGYIVALDLDLRHAIHFDRHALAGIDLGRLHVDGEQFEGKDINLFKNGPDERAAALDNPEAARLHGAVRLDKFMFVARDDQHLIGADFGVAAGPYGGQQENDQDNADGGDDHRADFSDVFK